MHFSVIIPVYNRPDEIVELLESLTLQSNKSSFEVIIIEDGSSVLCKDVIEPYFNQLNLQYYYQKNQGPGPARNYGASKAQEEYIIFFDSDCIIPSNYFKIVEESLKNNPLDCFGGPDKSHNFFTPIQKAISYSMTSTITTGGIRGGGKKMDKFYPRSFNLGIQKEIFESLSGFSDMRFGEDLDLSMRTMNNGHKVGLIKEASVYHKRRTTFRSFFKQVFNSGIARVDLSIKHPGTLKPVHLMPSAFTIGYPLLLILSYFISWWFMVPFALFPTIIFFDAWHKTKSPSVALLSTWSSIIQLTGYGSGFIQAFWVRIIKRKGSFHSFKQSFYD